MKFSALKNETMISPLENVGSLRPKSNRITRTIAATLILTSLVDAFSILVIYLLLNSSSSPETKLNKDIQLPVAEYSNSLKNGVGIQVVQGGYILNDNKLDSDGLLRALVVLGKELRDSNDPKQKSLIVQADQNIDFDRISPLLTIASEAGFEDIKFATVGGGS